MNSDPNRCPVCQCEMFHVTNESWSPTGRTYSVSMRCVDGGHRWTENLVVTSVVIDDAE